MDAKYKATTWGENKIVIEKMPNASWEEVLESIIKGLPDYRKWCDDNKEFIDSIKLDLQ